MQTILTLNWISTDPLIRAGRPCIVGTGLRVTDVVIAHLYHDQSADAIADAYSVPLAGVYAALAYYYDHKPELDADIREQIETAQRLRANWTANGGTPLLP